MRTTVDLDSDVLATVRAIAGAEGRPMGQVLSDLVRRGLISPTRGIGEEHGFPVFEVSADAAPITPAMIQAALEDSP